MSIGPMQLLIILVLVLVLFGAGKLPRVMGDIGKGIRNLKDGLNGKEVEKKPEALEKEKADNDKTSNPD